MLDCDKNDNNNDCYACVAAIVSKYQVRHEAINDPL